MDSNHLILSPACLAAWIASWGAGRLLITGVILCHRHRRIQDIDECDMTHPSNPSITSESHTQGEEQKGCVSSSLDRNSMDSSINYGLDSMLFLKVFIKWPMHYAHDYQSTFQHADMDTCATYVNYDHMFDCLHLGIYRWTQTWLIWFLMSLMMSLQMSSHLGHSKPTLAICHPQLRGCQHRVFRHGGLHGLVPVGRGHQGQTPLGCGYCSMLCQKVPCVWQFVAVSRVNLSQANVRSLFDFATCIGLSNCFNGKCCVTWMEVGSRCRGLWLMSCEATCWMFAWYTLLHYVIILHMKHACIRFDRTCSRTV